MKLLLPSFEIWEQAKGLLGIYQQIERCGRVCYKSQDKCTETSAEPFVQRMVANQHYAMLEHGTVYLACKHGELPFYFSNKFTHVNTIDGTDYITTNLRVLAENNTLADLSFLSPFQEGKHERRVTVCFTTQISITREYNRHRANSMAEQSTRYCNYTKDKFGAEISINVPSWVEEDENYQELSKEPSHSLADYCKEVSEGNDKEWNKIDAWHFANLAAEHAYMLLIQNGCKPQEARAILPLDTNTQLIHTAFVSDWLHFFDLRAIGTTGAPHPDAKALALPLMEEFKKKGFIE